MTLQTSVWGRTSGLVFRAMGLLMLLVGIGSLMLGPLEMVCFTWFEAGGRFAYEGFGFGSFMFGNMAMQILGYYLIAAVLIPLGYANLTLRRWARAVNLALVRCWVVLGVPLLVVVFAILLGTKELVIGVAAGAGVLAALSYAAFPGLLTRLYKSEGARKAFSDAARPADAVADWVEGLGVPILVVAILEVFWAAALHVLLFFNGLFPVPGGWATGLPGYAGVDAAIVILLAVVWGTARRRRWAWWASMVYFSTMLVLWVGALVPTSWSRLLDTLAFPPYEVGLLDGIPAQGWHFAVLVGLPIAGTLIAVFSARHHWSGRE